MFAFLGTVLTEEKSRLMLLYSLAILLVWFGAMNMAGPGAMILERWLAGHVFLEPLTSHSREIAFVLGLLEVAAAGLLAGRGRFHNQWLGAMVAVSISIFSLTLFFTNPVWIEALGGFPAIGSGQGLLKYVAILGAALLLVSPVLAKKLDWPVERMESAGRGLMLAGLVLVLVWIGGMKFTMVEAQGIDPLLQTSPFFSWMTEAFTVRGASRIVGVVEIITVVLLLCYRWSSTLFLVGGLLAVITFLSTLSFLVTLPGWDRAGFPLIGSTGHFLLKDLVLLAATLHLMARRLVR